MAAQVQRALRDRLGVELITVQAEADFMGALNGVTAPEQKRRIIGELFIHIFEAEARRLHREAQLRWDFIAAENSMGFHNPEEVLRILANATNLARQAQIAAIEAMP